MVVSVVGIAGDDLLEERGGVLALTAGGHALVVDHLGQRQAGGYKGESRFCLSVFCDVEASEAAEKSGFQRHTVSRRDLGQSGCGGLVLERLVLLLAQREQGGGIVWRLGDGALQALEALVGGGRGGAADVVLKRAEADSSGGGEEGLLGDGEVGIDALGHLPGDGVFHVEEARQIGRFGERFRHAELVDLQHLRLHVDAAGGGAGIGDVEAAHNDVVRVQGLRDADGGGAAGAEVFRQAQVFERVEAVVAADGEEAGGGEALVERVGEGVTDPVEIGLTGAVVEGQDQDQAATGLADVGGGIVGIGWREGCGWGLAPEHGRDGRRCSPGSEQKRQGEKSADGGGENSHDSPSIIEAG